jgi:hypothetical protein
MSGETVIHPEDLERMLKLVCEPKYKTGYDRNYYIWENYNPDHSYVISADVARGDGKDYSVFHVIDVTEMKQVAEYQGKPDLDMFSNILFDAGKSYGNSMLVVENNNVGYTVLTKLLEMQYPNLYHSIKSTHEYVEQYEAEHRTAAIPGFTTSSKTRPLIIAKLEEYIRNKLLTVNSSRFLNELKTFVWNNGKPEAMRGYNDDLILSMAIACWVRDTALITNQRDIDYKKSMLNAISKSSTEFDIKVSGQLGYNKTKTKQEVKQEIDPFIWIMKG